MNILVTLDSNYINPLKVMLCSLFFNNDSEIFNIYLIHSSISDKELFGLNKFIKDKGHALTPIKIPEDSFADAPLVLDYTKEMYYRLLAYKFLPESLHKILYLDPDILVLNEIKTLYDTDISNYLFAASYHDRVSLKEINRLRLKNYDLEEYFNSGVLLMNLDLHRQKISEKEIYNYVANNRLRLILPDQDILNSLYAKDIKKMDEILYNYDARYYLYYKLKSKGTINMDFIINNTAILHFCGKKKPWKRNYSGEFHSLYKHYEKMALGKVYAPSRKSLRLFLNDTFELKM